MSGQGPYLYVCLDCRETFKDKELKIKTMKCPNCGAGAYHLKEEKKLQKDIRYFPVVPIFFIVNIIIFVILFIFHHPMDPLKILGYTTAITVLSLYVWLFYLTFRTMKRIYNIAYGKKTDNVLKE